MRERRTDTAVSQALRGGSKPASPPRAAYDRIARTYDLLEWPIEFGFYRFLRSALWARVSALPGAILELGAGTGRNFAHHPNRTVYAVDISPKMLHRARPRRRSLTRLGLVNTLDAGIGATQIEGARAVSYEEHVPAAVARGGSERGALAAEPDLGLLLPCSVVVRETGDRVLVSAVDPGAILVLVTNLELDKIAPETRRRPAAAIEAA